MDSWGEPPNVRKGDVSPEENYQHLRRLQRREWWGWGYSVAIMLLLTFAVASLSIPSILEDRQGILKSGVFQSVSGLVFLIILFGCYLTYEKALINRLRIDLVERHSHSTLWRDLALVDPLTGLYNRRFAERHLKAEIARAERRRYALTVVMIDLDHFKEINDQYGHAAGDLVLMGFAKRLSKAIRESDIASRLGGDEFMLVLTEFEAPMLPSVLRRLESIQVDVNGQCVEVEFSVGCKELEAGQRAQELIDAADKALYENKQARRTQPSAVKG